jgi:uncharacterized protein YktA (UPF0223 family)
MIEMNIYSKKTKNILSKTDFLPDTIKLKELEEKMRQGFGGLLYLNKNNNLTIQYHGRFKSFTIGLGINPNNKFQPEQILLRIDTKNDQNHLNKNNAFSNELNSNKVHIHWNNTFIFFLLKEIDEKTKSTNKDYHLILKKICTKNQNISEENLKEAIPFKLFSKLIKAKNKKKSIDQYFEITLEEFSSYKQINLLKRIINKELSFFK